MKKILFSVVLAAFVLGSHASVAQSFTPLDFNKGLTRETSDDVGMLPGIASAYQNQVGILVNPNLDQRDDAIRPDKLSVNGAIAALFEGKSGKELASIAASAAKTNPNQAAAIGTAAVKRNIVTGGSPDMDYDIVSAIINAGGASLAPDTVASLIGVGTNRLQEKALDEKVRRLRSDYLSFFTNSGAPAYVYDGRNSVPADGGSTPSQEAYNAAKALDTQLVNYNVAYAMNLGDNLYSSLMNSWSTPLPATIDTNPFFTGDQGINNVGAQFGGGGGGGGGGDDDGDGGGGGSPDNPPPSS
ncbi:MAG: hypothetical protein WEB60_05110 [Terrimicrobiaceae bacterium]